MINEHKFFDTGCGYGKVFVDLNSSWEDLFDSAWSIKNNRVQDLRTRDLVLARSRGSGICITARIEFIHTT